ncbi:methyl-accepting chemotaxis protein [Paenibacillus filicis]|uniref:Methyl-accepting chemotaxis protein n=1 Tax=Paenibacillus filicis TaxID=669464 RepID=A0ABU9DC40_9BACL
MNLLTSWKTITASIRRRWGWNSVGGKLFILFFVCITLFVSLAGYGTFSIASRMIEDQVASASQQMIIQARQKLDMVYERYETFAFQFAIDNELQSTIRLYRDAAPGSMERQSQWDKLKTRFEDTLFRDSTLHLIGLYEPDGREMTLVGTHNRSQQQGQSSAAGQPWYRELHEKKQSISWIEPKDTSQDGVAFGLASSIQDPLTKQTIAYLLVQIKTDSLVQQLNTINLGKTGRNSIVNAQLETVLAAGAEGSGSVMPDIPVDASTGKRQKTGSVISRSGPGQGQLVVFDQATDERLSWYVVSSIALAEVLSGANRVFQVTLVIVLIAAAAAGALGVYVIRFIGRPLRVLEDMMRRGAEGDLSIRVHFERNDEIGGVGTSFNQMMQNIQTLVEQANESARHVWMLAEEVLGGAEQTTESARQVSQTASQIAGSTHLLAREAAETSEMTERVAGQMQQVVSENRLMEDSARAVQGVSEEGKRYMEQVVRSNRQVEAMTQTMQERVAELTQSTRDVAKIVTVLQGMTKQTNILSINASIEAARAGVHGRGFMVIADEIRKLSLDSHRSVEQVGRIAGQIRQNMEETVQVISEAQPLFQEQFRTMKQTDTLFGQVSEQTQAFILHLDSVAASIGLLQQSQSLLAQAMRRVSGFSEQTSASTTQVAGETESQIQVSGSLVGLSGRLKEMSRSLKESLSHFQT